MHPERVYLYLQFTDHMEMFEVVPGSSTRLQNYHGLNITLAIIEGHKYDKVNW